jgi:hypothetical protein
VKGTNIEASKREGRESKNQGTTVGMTEEIANYLGRKNARERKMMVATKRENISF